MTDRERIHYEGPSISETLVLRCNASGICLTQSTAKIRRNASRRPVSDSTSFWRYFQHDDSTPVNKAPRSWWCQSRSGRDPAVAASCLTPCGNNTRPDSVHRK